MSLPKLKNYAPISNEKFMQKSTLAICSQIVYVHVMGLLINSRESQTLSRHKDFATDLLKDNHITSAQYNILISTYKAKKGFFLTMNIIK